MPKDAQAEAVKDQPAVIEQQIEDVKRGDHEFEVERRPTATELRFTPDKGLPVWINYRNPTDPFELYEEVTYSNGPIRVVIPAGFKCDATSTPVVVFLLPAALQIAAAVLWYLGLTIPMLATWAIGALLAILLPWAMPGVGQLGLHARAAVVHDALYRTQKVARVVADAVMWEIMEYDRVRWMPKWVVYLTLRIVGGRAWRANAARLAALEAAKAAGVPVPVDETEPTSVVEPETPEQRHKRVWD